MSISRTLSTAAAALTLTGTFATAHAATYSLPGWVEAHHSAWGSASTTILDEDYEVGYEANIRFGAANWDVAANSFTRECLELEPGPFSVPDFLCPAYLFPTITSITGPNQLTTFDLPNSGREARTSALLTVPVTMMSESMQLFTLQATARGASYTSDTLSYGVWIAGFKIFSGSKNLPWTTRLIETCAEYAEVDASFTVGGIPVTAGMSAEGCMYVDASVTWTDDSVLSGSITPGSNIDATLWGGVGTSGYSAGVYGTVTVIDARVPFSLENRVTATGGTVEGNARATITGLDGEFGLYLDLFGDRVASKELFDWTGITFSDKTLFTRPITPSL